MCPPASLARLLLAACCAARGAHAIALPIAAEAVRQGPEPPTVCEETDDGKGVARILVHLGENGSQSRRVAPPPESDTISETGYWGGSHCRPCGHNYRCFGNGDFWDFDLDWGGANRGKVTSWTMTARGAWCHTGQATLSGSLDGTPASAKATGTCSRSYGCRCDVCFECTAESPHFPEGIPGFQWGSSPFSPQVSTGRLCSGELEITINYVVPTPSPTTSPTASPTTSPTASPTTSPTRPPTSGMSVVTTTVSGAISLTASGTKSDIESTVKPVLMEQLNVSDAASLDVEATEVVRRRKDGTSTSNWSVAYSFHTTDPGQAAGVANAASNMASNTGALAGSLATAFSSAGIPFSSSGLSVTPPSTSSTSPVAAVGDPHLVNVLGQRFDLMQPGRHALLVIPKGAQSPESLLLRADIDTKLAGTCSEIYISTLNVTGRWADWLHPEGLHFDAESPKVTDWTTFGSVDLKVVHGRTKGGISYLNMLVRHLTKVGLPIGGLLGIDDHTKEAARSPLCRPNVLALMGKGLSE